MKTLKWLQKDLQNQKLIQNLELKQIKDKQKIEKQTKKINKLQNQTFDFKFHFLKV